MGGTHAATYKITKVSSLFTAVWLKGANIQIACCLIWLVATVWSSFPLFGWGEYVPEPYGLSCTIAWRGYHTSAKDAFYVICSFACFTLVPVLLIVVSQCQIIYKVSRFSYLLSARGIRNNLRYTEKRLSMVSSFFLQFLCGVGGGEGRHLCMSNVLFKMLYRVAK